jgi:NADH:ubiquinone oxidoreductase subunit 6 (subunit J)
MGAAWFAFVPLALIAVLAGWMVFRFDSMARATLSLLVSFLAVSLILLLLDSPFLAFITFLMMIFEMMIMLLFMVAFMMNAGGLNPMQMVHQPRIAAGAGVTLFAVLAAAILTADFPEPTGAPPDDVTAALGFELMGPSMLIFETAGVTLLTGMIAVMAIAARRGRFGDAIRVAKPEGGGHHHHHHHHGGGHGGHGGGGHDHGGEDHDGHDDHGGHGGGGHHDRHGEA